MRGSRAAASVLLIAGSFAGACASQPPSPFFQDERFLVLGVDPDAETDALARQLEASGFRVVRRLRGQHFNALGAADADGSPAKVRVVTARGIALALDPQASQVGRAAVRYALLPSPSAQTHDADGDGFEEVFVQVLPESAEPPCIQVYRVLDSGFVDPAAPGVYQADKTASTDPAWMAPHFCPEPTFPDAGSTDAGPSPVPNPNPSPSPAPSPSGPARAPELGSPPGR